MIAIRRSSRAMSTIAAAMLAACGGGSAGNSGGGDGAPPPPTITPAGAFSDGFESGDLSHTENGIAWASSASTKVISGFGHSGTHSLRFTYAAGADSTAEQRFDLGAGGSQVTIAYWAYYPDGSEGLGPRFVHRASAPDNNKLVRLWRGDSGDGNDGYSDFFVKVGASTRSDATPGDESAFAEYGTDDGGVGPGGGTGNGPGASVDPFISDDFRGRWVPFRFVTRIATVGNDDGVIQLWRDGVLAFSVATLPTYPSNGQASVNFGYLLGYANSGFDVTTSVFVDDVTITVEP